MIALFWVLAVSILIGIMIAFEQIALLYVIATLTLVGLLITVGFADLESVGKVKGGGLASKE